MWKRRLLLLGALFCSSTTCLAFRPSPHQQSRLPALSAQQPPRKQISYARPSAAIERGSGFFIPGLEGPRVRLVGGSILLILTAINHTQFSFSETLTAFYSVLVLLQGLVEYAKEVNGRVVEGTAEESTSGSSSSSSLQQVWNVPSEDNYKERVQWAAATYLSLTSATHWRLIGPETLIYSLGSQNAPANDDATRKACQEALDTVVSSKSGRLSLPSDHPVSKALAPSTHNRCVILQRIDPQLAVLVSSDQLLASFSKQDQQWLGQLAKYLKPNPS